MGVVVGGSSIWFWFLSKKFKLSELRRHLLSLQHSVSGRGAAPGLVDSQKNITHVCNGRQWTNERQPRRKGTTTDSQGTRLKGVMAICATQSSTIRLLPIILVQPAGKNFHFNLFVQNDECNYSQTCLETTCYYSNIWFDGTALQTVALENGQKRFMHHIISQEVRAQCCWSTWCAHCAHEVRRSYYMMSRVWMMKQILTFVVVSTYGARHLWGIHFLRCLS